MDDITIRRNENGLFDVIQNGLTADQLGWDEMLGQVANLTHPSLGTPHYPMWSAENIAEAKARRAALYEKRNVK